MPYGNPYNEPFATKPMEPFRRYAVAPPHDARQSMTEKGLLWTTDTGGLVKSGARQVVVEVNWKHVPTDKGVMRINFEEKSTGDQKGALTSKVDETGTGVPIR